MRLSRSDCRKIVEDLVHEPLSEDIEDSCFDMPSAFKATARWHEEKPPMYEIPGAPKLSELLGGGLSHNGFTAVTGPTGAGKTVLVANWFVHLSTFKNGYVVPIEIGPFSWTDTCVSIVGNRMRRTLDHAQYKQAANEKIYQQVFGNKGSVLAKHTSRLSHMDLLAEIYYHHKTRNVEFAIGDNWNFMLEPARGQDANAVNDAALHDCIVFTKKVPVHIFMIFHPRKPEGRNGERVESIYDIKGSATSIQESTNVLIFNRLEKEEDVPYDSSKGQKKDIAFCREITVAKARWNGRARGRKVIYSIDDNSEVYHEHGIK